MRIAERDGDRAVLLLRKHENLALRSFLELALEKRRKRGLVLAQGKASGDFATADLGMRGIICGLPTIGS
jgi:hypothetical protein